MENQRLVRFRPFAGSFYFLALFTLILASCQAVRSLEEGDGSGLDLSATLPSGTKTPTASATASPTPTATPTNTPVPTPIPFDEYQDVSILKSGERSYSIRTIEFSPDGNYLATGGLFHNALFVWNMETQCPLFRLESALHSNNVSLAFSSDNSILAASYFGGTGIELWDLQSGRWLSQIETFGIEEHANLFGPNSLKFIGADSLFVGGQWSVELLSIPDGGSIEFEELTGIGHLENADISPDGKLIAASIISKNDIYVWEAEGTQLISKIELPDTDWWDNRTNLVFSPNSQFLAFGFRNVVNVWSVSSETTAMSFTAENELEQFGDILFSPDGKYLIANSQAPSRSMRHVYIWNLEDGSLFASFPARISGLTNTAVAVSPVGDYLAIGTSSGDVQLLGHPDSASVQSADNCDPVVSVSRPVTEMPQVRVLGDFEEGSPSQSDLFTVSNAASQESYYVDSSNGKLQVGFLERLAGSGLELTLDHSFANADQVVLQADVELDKKTTGAGYATIFISGKANSAEFMARCYVLTYGDYHFIDCDLAETTGSQFNIVYEAVSLYGGGGLQRAQIGTSYPLRLFLDKNTARVEFYRGDIFLGEYKFGGENVIFSDIQAGLWLWADDGQIHATYDNFAVNE